MNEPSELGALVFVCDRIPADVSYKTNFGGWGNFLVSMLFGPLIALFPAGLLLAGYEKLQGPQDGETVGILSLALIAAIGLAIDVLFILFFRWGYQYAQKLSIAVYEKGIFITLVSTEICKRYDEITDVYFGTRSELISGSLSIGKYLNWGMRAGEAVLRQRLTFKFNDGTRVRIKMCF